MSEIVMPRLSDSMEEGTILEWLKEVGDSVEVGEDLVEIETDKANMTYASDLAGTLVEILVPVNETRPIGTPIARIDSGEPPTEAEAPPTAAATGQSAQTSATPSDQSENADQVEAGGSRILASPVARRMASQRGLELASIEGSGPNGRILKHDVERASAGTTAVGTSGASGTGDTATSGPETSTTGAVATVEGARGEQTEIELNRLQQTIVRRMTQSKATIPHFHLQSEADMTEVVDAREHLREISDGPIPSINDLVVRACALTLREMPKLNGSYTDGMLSLNSRINVGVAVATEDALVVPTIFDADQKDLREIASESSELAARVRDGSVTPPELSGGTFTVSNLGMFGITRFEAIINPPQAAILAVGAIVKRVVPADGDGFEARDILEMTLGCDHRILYGADGAKFLQRVRELLEDPLALAL